MGRYYLMGAVLLLLGASVRSEDEYITEDTGTILPSTASPSVMKVNLTTPASSATPNMTLDPVVKAEAFASQEPSSAASNVASTAVTTERFEGRNESSPTAIFTVPTTSLSDQSMALTTTELPTTPPRDKDDGSRIPAIDRSFTNLTTTNNETESEGDGVTPAPDTEDKGTTLATTTKRPSQETTKDQSALAKAEAERKKKRQLILIGVIISILILLLVLMIFMILRKKKRSGSFRTNSKKKARQDVWAGQVPELGEGKAAQEVAENGTAGNRPEAANEEEMTTFTPGEKKMDSMIEMNELGAGGKMEANGGEKLAKGATTEEKTPLLEATSDASPKPKGGAEEFFPAPPVEQELMANGV